jgi:NAD(P)H dehydrogenase (quinone)
MSIVITGATGQLGRMIITDLLSAGVPAAGITALARDEKKAADLAAKGVQLHVSDYDRPATLTGAFGPEDRVLLISGTDVGKRTAQHSAVIDAVRAADVAQLAYVGVFGGPRMRFPLADEHRETEQLIVESGLPYTFLRNNWYSEVYVGDLGDFPGHGPEGRHRQQCQARRSHRHRSTKGLRGRRGESHERRRSSEPGLRAGR